MGWRERGGWVSVEDIDRGKLRHMGRGEDISSKKGRYRERGRYREEGGREGGREGRG
jgi:hypothetical protein